MYHQSLLVFFTHTYVVRRKVATIGNPQLSIEANKVDSLALYLQIKSARSSFLRYDPFWAKMLVVISVSVL